MNLHSFADRMAERVFTRETKDLYHFALSGIDVYSPKELTEEAAGLLRRTLASIEGRYSLSLVRRYIRAIIIADPYPWAVRNPPNDFLYLQQPFDRYESCDLAGYILRRAVYRRCVSIGIRDNFVTHKKIFERIKNIVSRRFQFLVDSLPK